MSTSNENKQAQAEVKSTEHLEVVIKLTQAQFKAVGLMDKLENLEKMAQGALDARIKGAWTAYAEKAEKSLGKVYDEASKRGFKNPLSKDEFLKQYGAEIKAVTVEL